jgi:hypothetical protein
VPDLLSVKDKQLHPLFLCLSGPGTGKSRLLNEFPRLVKESVHGIVDLNNIVNQSYCFKLSFENGTCTNPEPFNASVAIGTRMMYQLQSECKWAEFHQNFTFTIPEAIRELARITGKELSKICIILCIDGLQKLDHQLGSKSSPFYNTISAICEVINDGSVFFIAICSATVYHAANDILASSPQRRVPLIPPALDPKMIFNCDDDLTLLLASDMGGHGRALEQLYITLKTYDIDEYGYSQIMMEIVQRIRITYPDIAVHLHRLEPFILYVIARKKAHFLEENQIDDLLSLGLFRLKENDDVLEFPYILWLLYKSKSLPWNNYNSWAPREEEADVFGTWEEWEHFNCTFRILKSKAYKGQVLDWRLLHSGAKFGPSCDDLVEECELVFKKYAGHFNTASKPIGEWPSSCLHGSDALGRCIQVGHHSSSGDSFLCLHSKTNDWIHEVHQDKHLKGMISFEIFVEERKKSAANTDLFIMYSTGKIDEMVQSIPRSAYIDSSCWSDYYGPFSARAYFVKSRLPPLINEDDCRILQLVPGVGKAFATAVKEERSIAKFMNAEDAERRLKARKKLKNVGKCVKKFRFN